MGQILRYTVMLLRSYTRDRPALFFGFFFPLIFMLLFGVLNLGAIGSVDVAVVDEAHNADSATLVQTLSRIDALKVTTLARDAAMTSLQRSELDIVLVIPSSFRLAPVPAGSAPPTMTLYTDRALPEQGVIGSAIITQVVDQTSFAVTQTSPVVTLDRREISGRSARYVDFLTPGILGMTIMQLGISSVAFAFVVDRQRGVIRRIMATPISRRSFIAAHVLYRLIVAIIQVLILLGVAVLLFKVTVVGNLLLLLAVAALGSLLFLCLGFAVTGVVATENAAAPVTQLVTLPQMFLSGVFFSRDAAPAFLRPIADYLPLTFLNDALRDVATAGAGVADILPQLLGILVWTVVAFFLAFRFFRLD